ncbi:hypothetical protein FO440_23310 [Mucilaginibacter corticis]|uniref:Uncharacterized protein n=1 Tax=Mucilaginibacter corticis TaxID=2597670 RepID=A0A556M956_9SPHI|nr:hypothetical protein [Mucilaginibacter corticis]TSJ36432.1 hypothetical protein FO440_23310 [Mucilaginibacter corticis]
MMTPEEQVHEFLSKPFRSRNTLFEFNFYFHTENRGLMEVVYLLNEKVEFFRFEIDYADSLPEITFDDLEITLQSGEVIANLKMLLSEALYCFTNQIDRIGRKERQVAII